MNGWDHPNLTKHERIIQYIEQLSVGTRISVRKLAKDMKVSEGTAYRAIKDAEKMGIASTKERVGTVRIEKQPRNDLDNLTYADVLEIINGKVLGGEQGLGKTLHKFVIGAMQMEAMKSYIEPGSLLIVGNRIKAHRIALEHGAGVLITGGFDAEPDVVELADRLQLPIISSIDDTYSVASLINRAIYDRLIMTKIMLVEDLLNDDMNVHTLKSSNNVDDWQNLFRLTGHSRFPVVDEWNRVIGIVTPKDIVGASPEQTVDKLMTKQLSYVHANTSIAAAAHMMVWEGIELLPVLDHHRKLIGVISRKDVLKAMQTLSQQPQIGDTIEDIIWSSFEEKRDEKGKLFFTGLVTPQMTSNLGTVSEGVLATLITKAAFKAIKEQRKGNLVLENITTYFVRPVQIESKIDIYPSMIEVSRKFGKVDVEIFNAEHLVCKALLTAQVIYQN